LHIILRICVNSKQTDRKLTVKRNQHDKSNASPFVVNIESSDDRRHEVPDVCPAAESDGVR